MHNKNAARIQDKTLWTTLSFPISDITDSTTCMISKSSFSEKPKKDKDIPHISVRFTCSLTRSSHSEILSASSLVSKGSMCSTWLAVWKESEGTERRGTFRSDAFEMMFCGGVILPVRMIPAVLVSREARIMSLRSPPVITILFPSWKGG